MSLTDGPIITKQPYKLATGLIGQLAVESVDGVAGVFCEWPKEGTLSTFLAKTGGLEDRYRTTQRCPLSISIPAEDSPFLFCYNK